MKPTSVIFLILSVILIAAGFVICITAQKMAEANDIQLFYQETDFEENGIEFYEFKLVNKISLYLGDADVKIIFGAEKSEVKLVNFSKNTYECLVSNKNLSIDDSISFISLFKITSEGFNFEGLRHFMQYNRFKDKDKYIEIYVSDDNEIKQFDIEVDNGDVSIINVPNQADYNISIGKGNLDLGIDRSISNVKIEVKNGDVRIAAPNTYTGNIDIKIGEGNLYSDIRDNQTRSYKLDTKNGEVTFFGNLKDNTFEINPIESLYTFDVSVDKGNIEIAHPSK